MAPAAAGPARGCGAAGVADAPAPACSRRCRRPAGPPWAGQPPACPPPRARDAPPPPHAGRAMRAMQAELAANPAAGCLAVRHTEAFANPTRLVQIWRRRAPRRRGAAGARRARPPSLGSPPRARAARAAAGRACCARRARKRRRPPRSYDHLAAFARDGMAQHLGTWMAWDAKARAFKGREVPGVGIYHESYLVSAGSYEAIYRNMPPMGLAKVGRIVSVSAAGPGVCVRVRARVCGGARVRARGCVRVCAVWQGGWRLCLCRGWPPPAQHAHRLHAGRAARAGVRGAHAHGARAAGADRRRRPRGHWAGVLVAAACARCRRRFRRRSSHVKCLPAVRPPPTSCAACGASCERQTARQPTPRARAPRAASALCHRCRDLQPAPSTSQTRNRPAGKRGISNVGRGLI